ncbi:hypothetical protein MMYC01_201104 [Madurella mycetomatis]|uniref:Reticulocyte-binding protein 2 a n=1 Tax=Madurella mycetomatis TaxID=100816 RepID=A0A175WGL0_9PEZI|nr:hypothetical protein MMYC01_201104 [Madurella mycetomatis]
MPGFDDTERPDFEIIEQLVCWVQKNAANGQHLAGILFLHPITQNRLQGSNRRMLSTFKKLLGNDYFKKVLLITTFWNDVQQSVGEQRERELKESDDAWKPIIDAGAQTERMARDYDRFIPLLEKIAGSSAPRLQIQLELNQGKSLEQAMSGLSLDRIATEQDRRLEGSRTIVNTTSSRNKQKSQEAIDAWKETSNLLYKGEIEAQRLENSRIMAQIQEQDSRQDAIRQQKRRELEEQMTIAEELRKARKQDQEEEEQKNSSELTKLSLNYNTRRLNTSRNTRAKRLTGSEPTALVICFLHL